MKNGYLQFKWVIQQEEEEMVLILSKKTVIPSPNPPIHANIHKTIYFIQCGKTLVLIKD